MKRLRWLIGTALLGSAVMAGCSDVEPGDYIVYRIASAQQSFSDGCYWPNGESPNTEADSNSLRASGTIILFAGPDDTFYIDLGGTALAGANDGEDDSGTRYAFDGRVVDVEWDGADGTGNRRTTTVKTTVEFGIDGAMIVGEQEVKTSYECTGDTCGEVPPSCTITTEFVGTEVEDVALEHDIAPGVTTPTTPPAQGPGNGAGGNGAGGNGAGGNGAGGNGGAGAGGNGVGGSTGSCLTCSEMLAGGVGTVCDSSASLYYDVSNCACNSCWDSCEANLCVEEEPSMSSECMSCTAEMCNYEFSACLEDSPAD